MVECPSGIDRNFSNTEVAGSSFSGPKFMLKFSPIVVILFLFFKNIIFQFNFKLCVTKIRQ